MSVQEEKKVSQYSKYGVFLGQKLADKLFTVTSSFNPNGEPNLSVACFHSDLDDTAYFISKKREENLYLGCGRDVHPNFTNLDVIPHEGVDVVADLEMGPNDRLPLEDDRFDCIYSYMTLEHIKNTLRLGEELWRITRNDGLFYAQIPWWSSWRTWGDPTHVKAFAEQSFSFWQKEKYKRSAEIGGPMGQYDPQMDWTPLASVLVLCENQRGKSKEDLNFACAHLINVVSHLFVVLRCKKP